MNRLSNQPQVPLHKQRKTTDTYDIFPAFELEPNKIQSGYKGLFDKLKTSRIIIWMGM